MNISLAKVSFFIVAVLWGSSFPFQKQLLVHISAINFTFWNFFLSGIVFLLYALYTKTSFTAKLREGIILGLFLGGIEIFQMIGLAHTTAANTVFLSNLGMLIIPYLGWLLLKHKVTLKNTSSIVLAGIGMYFLVGGIKGFGFGEGMLLLSAVFMGLYFLYSEQFGSRGQSHVLSLLVQQFFVTAILCLIAGFFVHDTFFVPSSLYVTLGWQTILFTTLPYVLVQWACKYADEMTTVLYDGVIEPLVGGVVAWVIFKEATTTVQVLGGFLMIFAFAFAQIISRKHFFRKVVKL